MKARTTRTIRRHYAGKQIHAEYVQSGSTIVAVEGAMRVRFRDSTLAWLPEAPQHVTVLLHEGDRYVITYNTLVEIHVETVTAARGLILEPIRWPTRAGALLRSVAARILSRREANNV